MKTIFLLMAEFDSPIIPLEAIRERYFNLSTKEEADRRARNHKLPVSAFRMGGQRSQWFVHVEELAGYIDKLASEQKKDWSRINCA